MMPEKSSEKDPMTFECVVHHRRYLSQFHANINELRRSNEFQVSILGKLPKRCCSCNNQTGESSFTVNHLRTLCREIELAEKEAAIARGGKSVVAPARAKVMHYMTLTLPPKEFVRQRIRIVGRFVGKNGKNIQAIERGLNITMHLRTPKSSKTLRELTDKIKAMYTQREDDLPVFFTLNNDNGQAEKIKQKIESEWNTICMVFKNTKQTKTVRTGEPKMYVSLPVEGDSRWKPKRRTPGSKLKAKERQSNEQAPVAPQPLVKPISMPKEIVKSYKKR